MMGVAALQEWCQKELEGYPGVRITDMSSSWRDGLAFCALIHRYKPGLIDFHGLDPDDWHGNCLLAFSVAESELGVPQLLDVDYVVRSESPDQFFIMTYVAQFYHKFTLPDSGYDSTFTTSFKYSSSEDDNHHHQRHRHHEQHQSQDHLGKRRAPVQHQQQNDWKRKRPIGLVVSGGLELRLDGPDGDKDVAGNEVKLYDADDEEGGEASEVVLRQALSGAVPEARSGNNQPHQDLVLKRKRPNSLNRVSPMDKENITKCKSERRSSKRLAKPKIPEAGVKRKMIGVSDYPKPYRNTENDNNFLTTSFLTDRKREHSVESEENSSNADSSVAVNDSLKEKLRDIPDHISENQKLLKTSIFQMPQPQFPTKCLILNIYKIKHQQLEDKSTSPPPTSFMLNENFLNKNSNDQKSLQEIDHLVRKNDTKFDEIQQKNSNKNKNISKPSENNSDSQILRNSNHSNRLDQQSQKLNSKNTLFKTVESERDKSLMRVSSENNNNKLTVNVLKKEKNNELFAQLTQKEKIEKFLSHGEKNKNRLDRLTRLQRDEEVSSDLLTPRTKSKFEHLIKNLKESNEDEQLVIYKMMDADPEKKLTITDFVPYKGEPKDKYSIEFLWNIGAANYVGSGRRNQGRHHKRRKRF